MSPGNNSKMDDRDTTGVKPTPNDSPKSRASTAKEGSAMEIHRGFRNYTANPFTDLDARIQGLVMLQAILNDHKGEIAESILDWEFEHTLAQRSTYVEMMLTGEKADHDTAFQQLTKGKLGRNVAFIIATWCMLGGNTASTWAEVTNGQKPGKKKTQMDWGKKMVMELQLLGKTAHAEFEICKPYVTGKLHGTFYNYDAASRYFQSRNKRESNPKTHGNAKHAADFSPQNPDLAKRRRTSTQSGQTQQETEYQTPTAAQLNNGSEPSEGATTDQEDDIGTTNGLLAKLSREQLEVMNRVLKSKVDSLEKQSALRLERVNEWSTRANSLQDIVDEAANHGTDTLDLVQANIDLRKKNDEEEQMITMNKMEARLLKKEIASLKQSLLNL